MDISNKYDQLIEEGYCVFENLLSIEMQSSLREVTENMLENQTNEEKERFRSQGSLIPVSTDPMLAELIAYPDAIRALGSLGYMDPKFMSGYIISKPPKSPRLFWHSDYMTYDDSGSIGKLPEQLFLMYYLQDTTPYNGCLRIIPGSHLHENLLHHELEEAHTETLARGKDLSLPAFSTRPDEMDIKITAGDLLIGDSRLLHASHSNESNHRRTVITLWYLPDFHNLSDSAQAFYASVSMKMPEQWPKKMKNLIEPFIVKYEGDAEPLRQNRNRPLSNR